MEEESTNDYRKDNFKAGIKATQCTARRVESANTIRKEKRANRLANKRRRNPLRAKVNHTNQHNKQARKQIVISKQDDFLSNDQQRISRALHWLKQMSRSLEHMIIEMMKNPKMIQRLVWLCGQPIYTEDALYAISGFMFVSELTLLFLENTPILNISLASLKDATTPPGARSAAIWIVGNISAERNPKWRNEVIKRGGVDILVEIFRKIMRMKSISNVFMDMRDSCIWAIRVFYTGHDPDFEVLEKKEATGLIIAIMCRRDDEVLLEECTIALKSAAENFHIQNQLLNTPRLLKRLCELSQSTNTSIQENSLRILGSLSSAFGLNSKGVKYGDVLIVAGILQPLENLLNSDNLGLRQEALFIVENLLVGRGENYDCIISDDTDILNFIILNACANEETLQSAGVFALCNVLSCLMQSMRWTQNLPVINKLLDQIKEPFFGSLDSKRVDLRLRVISCIEQMTTVCAPLIYEHLAGGDGIKTWMSVIEHVYDTEPMQKISDIAGKILDKIDTDERLSGLMEVDTEYTDLDWENDCNSGTNNNANNGSPINFNF